jgi:hypothetical protein
MKLIERINKIKELQDWADTPFFVKKIFGEVTILGSQIQFGKDNDFVEVKDFKKALTWLNEQFQSEALKVKTELIFKRGAEYQSLDGELWYCEGVLNQSATMTRNKRTSEVDITTGKSTTDSLEIVKEYLEW